MVYLAWNHRSWPRSVRLAGLSAAAGGALAGTWLGLHAVSGLYSAFIAVFCAILGSNLAVLLRDIWLGTPSADRSDSSTTKSPTDTALPTATPVT